MSLPLVFRPIARLEMAEALGWYQKQKAGLEAEFKDAVDPLAESFDLQLWTRLGTRNRAPGRFSLTRPTGTLSQGERAG